MTRLARILVGSALLGGCAILQPAAPAPPVNAGYCASLSLLLDSVDPRMAAQARADMQHAGCAAAG